MYRLKSLSLVCLLAVAVFFAGCGDKEKQPEIKVENETALSQTVYADQTSGKSGVTIVTSGAWSSSVTEGSVKSTKAGAATWVSINPDHGGIAGKYTIDISLEPNATGNDRTATITITCNGEKIAITVTQKGTKEDGEPYVEPEKSSECSILSFTVNGVSWTINSSNLTITHLYPQGTNLSNLIPDIVCSERATIRPASGIAQDFSDGKPVTYTVTAEDGTMRVYVAKADVEVNGKVKLLETATGEDGRYDKYEYDSQNRLTKITGYYDNGEPDQFIYLTYTGNDLTKYEYGYSGEIQITSTFVKNGNTITETESQSGEVRTVIYELNSDGYPGKISYSGEGWSRERSFLYDGGNQIKVTYKGIDGGDTYERSEYFKYDSNNAPFLHCQTPRWFLFYYFETFGGKNNPTEWSWDDDGGTTKIIYTYVYDDDNYPTKVTQTKSNEEGVYITEYKYK